VPDAVLPGDLESGDLIVLPGGQEELTVVTIRLGHGGFLLTALPSGPAGSPAELVITLAAGAQVRRTGRVPPAGLRPSQVTP
jgi:hypothetical protein